MGDVEAILRASSERLDLGRVRSHLRLLEEALGQADLLPRFDDAVRAAARS